MKQFLLNGHVILFLSKGIALQQAIAILSWNEAFVKLQRLMRFWRTRQIKTQHLIVCPSFMTKEFVMIDMITVAITVW